MNADDLPTIARVQAKAQVRDGDRLFLGCLFDNGEVSICALALRPGFDGSADHHWTKPVDEAGEGVAHASNALLRDGLLVPDPPYERESGDLVELAVLMRPEAVAAMARGLTGRWRGHRVEVLPPTGSP